MNHAGATRDSLSVSGPCIAPASNCVRLVRDFTRSFTHSHIARPRPRSFVGTCEDTWRTSARRGHWRGKQDVPHERSPCAARAGATRGGPCVLR